MIVGAGQSSLDSTGEAIGNSWAWAEIAVYGQDFFSSQGSLSPPFKSIQMIKSGLFRLSRIIFFI